MSDPDKLRQISASDSPAMAALAASESMAPSEPALPGLPLAEYPASRGFWALTWQQFRKRRESYIALFALGLLFLMAFSAPLLANNLPWFVRSPQGISMPLLRDYVAPISALDRFYNCAFMALIAIFFWRLIARAVRRGDSTRVSMSRVVNCWLLVFGCLFALAAWIGGKNDTADYRAKAEMPGTSAVFTLIPYGVLEINLALNDRPPSGGHLLGNDNDGYDVLTRIVHGSRISLAVGFLAIGLAVSIGIVVGSLSGYFGGVVDIVASRIIEVFICFPSFFLILTIISIAPTRSIFWVMFAIGLTGWMGIARLIRGEVLKVRQLDYIAAAKALGAQDMRIIFRHILPNALAPVLVAATFGIAGAILSETALGFLGLGVEPPTPSWGELLNQARENPVRLWWLMVYPGFMIFLSVTLMNLVGEGLRDAMDPRLRK